LAEPLPIMDLSGDDPLDQDFSPFLARKDGWVPLHFNFVLKDRPVSLRLPKALVESYQRQGKELGIPYQSLMRQALVDSLGRLRKPPKRAK
jgi:predicted DNA binding CopG/RHH family protein